MPAARRSRIDIVDSEIGATDNKDIQAMHLVAIDEWHLVIGRSCDENMGTIDQATNAGHSGHLEIELSQTIALVWISLNFHALKGSVAF